MTPARIESGPNGALRVSGELTFATVRDLFRESRAQFDGRRDEIDLSAVTTADSAGLALLIEWYRWAERSGKQIRFVGVPAQLRALAKISDVDRLLPFNVE